MGKISPQGRESPRLGEAPKVRAILGSLAMTLATTSKMSRHPGTSKVAHPVDGTVDGRRYLSRSSEVVFAADRRTRCGQSVPTKRPHCTPYDGVN